MKKDLDQEKQEITSIISDFMMEQGVLFDKYIVNVLTVQPTASAFRKDISFEIAFKEPQYNVGEIDLNEYKNLSAALIATSSTQKVTTEKTNVEGKKGFKVNVQGFSKDVLKQEMEHKALSSFLKRIKWEKNSNPGVYKLSFENGKPNHLNLNFEPDYNRSFIPGRIKKTRQAFLRLLKGKKSVAKSVAKVNVEKQQKAEQYLPLHPANLKVGSEEYMNQLNILQELLFFLNKKSTSKKTDYSSLIQDNINAQRSFIKDFIRITKEEGQDQGPQRQALLREVFPLSANKDKQLSPLMMKVVKSSFGSKEAFTETFLSTPFKALKADKILDMTKSIAAREAALALIKTDKYTPLIESIENSEQVRRAAKEMRDAVKKKEETLTASNTPFIQKSYQSVRDVAEGKHHTFTRLQELSKEYNSVLNRMARSIGKAASLNRAMRQIDQLLAPEKSFPLKLAILKFANERGLLEKEKGAERYLQKLTGPMPAKNPEEALDAAAQKLPIFAFTHTK